MEENLQKWIIQNMERDIKIETIEKMWISIYDRIQDCIDPEGKLTN